MAEGCLIKKDLEAERLAEISSPEFPGERLVACYNPQLAEQRRHKRRELLAATQAELEVLAASVGRPAGKPETAAEIGVRAGKIINHYKMAKHFTLTIRDGYLGWARKQDAIQKEELLDGIYVIRTSEPADRLTAANGVRSYKRLALVEQSFRCFKGIDLFVHPFTTERLTECGRTSCCACWPFTWNGTCDRPGNRCCLRMRNWRWTVSIATQCCLRNPRSRRV